MKRTKIIIKNYITSPQAQCTAYIYLEYKKNQYNYTITK